MGWQCGAGAHDGKPPPLVLLTPPPELEPWVGLPGGRALGNEKTAAQVFGKSLRSSTKRGAARAKPAKYGAHWLVEEVPKWVDLLDADAALASAPEPSCSQDEQPDEAAVEEDMAQRKAHTAAVENVRGSVWLVQYLLQAWQLDLDARVQVRALPELTHQPDC